MVGGGEAAAGSKAEAWRDARSADRRWEEALEAHRLAPPDAGFGGRLRQLSAAAVAERAALEAAAEAGLEWRPVGGSERAQPPYELRPGTGRRGPADRWSRFDAAVERLNVAGAGDDLAAVVAAFGALADAAAALADALEQG